MAERASVVGAATADRLGEVEAATADPVRPVEPANVMPYSRRSLETPRTEGPLPVRVLRADGNVAFESYAAICPGAPEKNVLKRVLPWVFDERDFATYGELKKFCLIKSDENIVYVYADESHASPLYGLPLQDLVPILEDRKRPHKFSITISPLPNSNESPENMVTVLLTSGKTLVHQFSFDTSKDPTIARRFYDCVHIAKQKGKNHDEKKTITTVEEPQKV